MAFCRTAIVLHPVLHRIPLPQHRLKLGDALGQCLRGRCQLGMGVPLAHLHQVLGVAAPRSIPLLQEHPQGLDDGLCLILGHPTPITNDCLVP